MDSAASTPEDHHYEGLQINRQGEEYEKPKKTYDYAYTESDKSTIGKEASTLKVREILVEMVLQLNFWNKAGCAIHVLGPMNWPRRTKNESSKRVSLDM